MPQNYLRGKREGVVLSDRESLVGDQRQSIDIGIDRHSNVAVGILHQLLKLSQVFGDGLWRSGKPAIRLHVDRCQLAPEQLQKDRHEHPARTANAVECHPEFLLPDPFDVEKREGQNSLYMLSRRVLVLSHGSELVPRRSRDVSLDDLPHLCSFLGIEKQSRRADELERVPFDGIVARSDG